MSRDAEPPMRAAPAGLPPMRAVPAGHGEFPPDLAHADPSVECLWVMGKDLRSLGPCVGIVGTRSPTPYGLEVASSLAADLAALGVCVVSGMARGIDAAAHEGALSAGGTTIAVLGSGADVAYPACNRELHRRIAMEGAVVSELPPGSPARKHNFPARNRIIAWWSLAVVIVQAEVPRSGALITARAAVDAGREVLAVPGDVRSGGSTGPHMLLREGARLCAGAWDVLDAIDGELTLRARVTWADRDDGAARVRPPDTGDEEMRAARGAIAEGPAGLERIASRAGLDIPTATRALLRLEMGGAVTRGHDGIFRPLR